MIKGSWAWADSGSCVSFYVILPSRAPATTQPASLATVFKSSSQHNPHPLSNVLSLSDKTPKNPVVTLTRTVCNTGAKRWQGGICTLSGQAAEVQHSRHLPGPSELLCLQAEQHSGGQHYQFTGNCPSCSHRSPTFLETLPCTEQMT